jgi:hypothetical protein
LLCEGKSGGSTRGRNTTQLTTYFWSQILCAGNSAVPFRPHPFIENRGPAAEKKIKAKISESAG